MLVLSRRRNERIIMGSGDARVEVVVIDIRPDKVRLGVDAPRDYPVHRSEIYAAIERSSHDSPSRDKLPGVLPRDLHINSSLQPTILSARDSHLLLRFPSSEAMSAAVARGLVSFFPQEA